MTESAQQKGSSLQDENIRGAIPRSQRERRKYCQTLARMRTDDHGLKFGLMNQTSVDVPLRT